MITGINVSQVIVMTPSARVYLVIHVATHKAALTISVLGMLSAVFMVTVSLKMGRFALLKINAYLDVTNRLELMGISQTLYVRIESLLLILMITAIFIQAGRNVFKTALLLANVLKVVVLSMELV